MNTTWHDIRDPADPRLDTLAAQLGLHPLHIEDCRHRNQSAKIEALGNYIFTVLKPVELSEECVLKAVDLDLFLGPDYLLSVQENECSPLSQLLDRLRSSTMNGRPDQTFHRIIDAVVDSYNPVLDRLSDEIEEMEDKALTCPEPTLLERLFDVRRAMIQLRRIMANTRDVLGNLMRSDYGQIGRDLMPFFRDVYDHVNRNLDLIEVYRDLLTGAMELYLSAVANRTNQTMKLLTVFGTVATPALVITGVYGMNLQHLPFADHPHSWGIVSGIIAFVSLGMLVLMRRFRWL